MVKHRSYLCIDLKSFYASVECVERGLDPLKTNLVVADASRTEKTICLAVSPSLKAYGIPGRPRLFEVVQKVKEINNFRQNRAPMRKFVGESYDTEELAAGPQLSLAYITAVPRMAMYMQYSARIYEIYLKFIAPEDIHVYSIDEVFMDITDYLEACGLTAQELARSIILEVYKKTGITATAGIGTNLYLSKIAMDITAKHADPDSNGVRMAQLDEMSYRRQLWDHRPLTDFWRIGKGYQAKLESNGLYTMGDVARCSVAYEDRLYKLFGINAELLIDHAWGWESCTMADIKAYRPAANSISSGQVLSSPYHFDKAKLIVREMTEAMVLDLVDKHLVTGQMVLTIGYDAVNLTDPEIRDGYNGEIKTDRYGRDVPKHAHGSQNLSQPTSSTRLIMDAVMILFDRIVDRDLSVKRINLTAAGVIPADEADKDMTFGQLDMFSDQPSERNKRTAEESDLDREKKRQQAILSIKKKFGKNAILNGASLEEGATAIERNNQIGGHKA